MKKLLLLIALTFSTSVFAERYIDIDIDIDTDGFVLSE